MALATILGSMLLAAEPRALIPFESEWSYQLVGSSRTTAEDEAGVFDASGVSWLEADFAVPWSTGRAGSGLVAMPEQLRAHRTRERRQFFRLRHTFELTEKQLAAIQGLRLRVVRGDGITVHLNGVEVYELGSTKDSNDASRYNGVKVPRGYYHRWHLGREHLIAGTNVVAVETYRRSSRADDPDFDLELTTTTENAVVWRGPYLQKGAPDSATLRFATDIPTQPVLHYGKLPDRLNKRQSGLLAVDHTMVVEALEPDTTYYYAVKSKRRWLIAPSRDHRFHTHPRVGTEKPVRIWVLGDSGRGQFGGSADVRDAYRAYTGERETDVWLMLGNNAYDEGRFEEYQDALFDVYPEVLRNTFLWPAIGNRDIRAFDGPESGPYLDLFDLPAHGESGGVRSNAELYYSFDYGNIHFVVLDCEIASLELVSPQIEWLQRDLKANKSEWLIAVVHVPPYSRGSHDSDRARRHSIVREKAVPILEAHGMDLLLSGHSHAYERSHLIRGHYGTSASWNAEIHLVDGGNGCPADASAAQCSGGADGAYVGRGAVYAVVGCSSCISARGNLDHPAMVRGIRSLGSLVIDVEGDQLEARFLQGDGEIGDRFVIRHPDVQPGDKTRSDE